MKSHDLAREYLSHPRYGGPIRNSIRLLVIGVLAALTASIFPVIGGHNPGPEVSPEVLEGNAECQKPGGQPDLAKPGQTWLEAKDDSPPFTGATGPGGFVATITHTGRTVDWTANMAVDGVLTKPGGGQDGRNHFYRYDDPTVSPNDDVQVTPNDPGEVEKDDALTWTGSTGLSHVTFCYDLDPNLKVQKSSGTSSVDSGGDVSFRIDATNAGGAAASGVSVTDDLEDGLTGVVATYDNDPGSVGGTGNCSVESGNKVVCPIGDLAAADADNTGAEPDAASIFIQAKAPTDDCGDIVNTAQVSAANEPESHVDDNVSNVVTVAVRCPDVEVDKSSSATSVDAGGAFSFLVTGSNSGEAAATSVQVVDDLEDDLADVSASFDVDPKSPGGTGACSVESGNKVTCNVGTLAPSDGNMADAEPDVVAVTISAKAPSQRCDDVENVASISASNEPSENRSNNSSGSPVTVGIACADVVVTKSAGSSAVDTGAPMTYRLEGRNQGDASAQSVSVRDNLDDRLNNVSASFDVDPGNAGGTGTCTVTSGNAVTCDVGTLAANDGNTSGAEPDVVVVSISATAPASDCGNVPNQASIASTNEPSGNQGNNQSAAVNVTIRCSDVTISKGASSSTIGGGAPLTYTLTGRNDGGGAATGVVVTDNLDDDLTNVSATFDVDPGAGGGTGNCSVGQGNVVRCEVGNLSASDGNTMGGEPDTVVVTINTTGPTSCQTVTNQSSISAANEPSSATSNNTSNQVNVTVECADVAVTKSSTSPTVDAGSRITYSISGRNDGKSAAVGVVIRDNLDDRLTNVSASYDVDPTTPAGASGTCSVTEGNVITCNIGTLAASDGNTSSPESDIVAVSISATVPSSACGTIPNRASIESSNEPSENDGNNTSDVVNVTVRCADLAISKSASSSSVEAGTPISYTITARNDGGGADTGVIVKDNLDDDLTGVSASFDVDPGSDGGTGSCKVDPGHVVTCEVGNLAGSDGNTADAEPDIVVVTINATAPGTCQTMTNVATVSGTNEPSSASSNNSSNQVTVTVRCADVSVRKAASSSSVNAGDPVTYTVTATNGGSAKATAVVVKDNLNDNLAGVSATYDRDPNSEGETGSCSVSQTGNEVTCSIASLEASDGNTDGSEPDVAVITIRATTTSDTCGNVDNVSSVSAQNEPSANNGNNSSGTVRVAVVCAQAVAQVVEATANGLKFRDVDGDGAAREDGDPALSGWRIYVDYNNNGTLDSGEPFDDTDSNGVYEITGIDAGKFRIREVAQGSWTCTFPNPCFYEETFDAGESLTGKNFGNRADVQVAPERFEREQGAPAPPPAAPSDPSGREIAATGAPSLALNLFGALMLIIAGIGLVLVSRRRFEH